MEGVDKKTREIDKLYAAANEKLIALKEAIPNVDEYSARDILALAVFVNKDVRSHIQAASASHDG